MNLGSVVKLGLVALITWSHGPLSTAGDATPSNLRKPAPDLTLTDSNGAPIGLSDYKGKVVLLDF